MCICFLRPQLFWQKPEASRKPADTDPSPMAPTLWEMMGMSEPTRTPTPTAGRLSKVKQKTKPSKPAKATTTPTTAAPSSAASSLRGLKTPDNEADTQPADDDQLEAAGVMGRPKTADDSIERAPSKRPPSASDIGAKRQKPLDPTPPLTKPNDANDLLDETVIEDDPPQANNPAEKATGSAVAHDGEEATPSNNSACLSWLWQTSPKLTQAR